MNPLFRWPGGKRSLVEEYRCIAMPALAKATAYFEPFIGGGAMFFRLRPDNAVIADTLAPLMTSYQMIAHYPAEVAGQLSALATIYGGVGTMDAKQRFYYQQRDRFNESDRPSPEYAARFLFLNRTCYNALIRFNQSGGFNTPFGYRERAIVPSMADIIAASSALQATDLRCADFEDVLQDAPAGAFVYADPPYDSENGSGFTMYSGNDFTRDDQARLAQLFGELTDRGVYAMLSNADTNFIRKAYAPFAIHEIRATRSIAADGDKRGTVDELVIVNFDEAGHIL